MRSRTLTALDVVSLAEEVGAVLERRGIRERGTRLLYSFGHAAEMLDMGVSAIPGLVAAGELDEHRDPLAGKTAARRVTGKSLAAYVRRHDQSLVKNHRSALSMAIGTTLNPGGSLVGAPRLCPHGVSTVPGVNPRSVCNDCSPATACSGVVS
jgi:hypothetical protein